MNHSMTNRVIRLLDISWNDSGWNGGSPNGKLVWKMATAFSKTGLAAYCSGKKLSD